MDDRSVGQHAVRSRRVMVGDDDVDPDGHRRGEHICDVTEAVFGVRPGALAVVA